ncbi:MAG: S26 family signal peptidase [Caulobacter sp.]
MAERLLTSRGWALAALSAAAILAVLGPAVVGPAPRLVWNASASAPVGLWRIDPTRRVLVGDTVLVEPPPAARKLAAERRYLPSNVPMLKRAAAVSGDVVCAIGDRVSVNDRLVAVRRLADRKGRPLPWWSGCERLPEGAVLLINPAPDSFDGRYFGPVGGAAIIGRARLLWRR